MPLPHPSTMIRFLLPALALVITQPTLCAQTSTAAPASAVVEKALTAVGGKDKLLKIFRFGETFHFGEDVYKRQPADLIAEGLWPASGKKSLGSQSVLLGLMWKPTPGAVFTRFHISDIWLDDAATQRAAQSQTETHKTLSLIHI